MKIKTENCVKVVGKTNSSPGVENIRCPIHYVKLRSEAVS